MPFGFQFNDLIVSDIQKENKMTFNINSESSKFENYENAQYNADNASMHSSAAAEEIDIVDIYKNKMKTNIRLKKKNLILILFLFLLSFCGLLILSGFLAYFLRNKSHYIFESTFAFGFISTQHIVSEMFAISFYAQTRFINEKFTSEIGSGNFCLLDDEEFDQDFPIYFNQTRKDIELFIENASKYHTPKNNSIDNFLFRTPMSWKINSTTSINATFLSFVKQAYISMDKNMFRNYSLDNFNFWTSNYEKLIEVNMNLANSINEDLDASLASTVSFMNNFILFRFFNKRSIFYRGQSFDHIFVHACYSWLQFDFHFAVQNQA